MTENYYNILWADDEIETLVTEELEYILQKLRLNIICKANNSEDAKKYLEENTLKVDAVITDANFGDSPDEEVTSERMIYGLAEMLPLAEKYSSTIPFYLYTQRDESLIVGDSQVSPKRMKYFTDNNYERWFKKSGSPLEMLKKIRSDIESIKSPKSQIRNLYKDEFEAASLFPNAEDLLIEGLLFDYSTEANIESADKYFTPVRMIFENIVDELTKQKYLPKLSSLNCIPDFLHQREVEGFVLQQPIMPKPLIHSLNYFLDITQDGSHNKQDLKLGVIDYVRERQNANLFKSVLYIIMDVLLWYKDLLDNPIDTKDLWKGAYEAEGKICAKMNKGRQVFVLNGKYQIENKGNLVDGMEIGVRKSTDTKFPFENVTRFVYNSDIIIK